MTQGLIPWLGKGCGDEPKLRISDWRREMAPAEGGGAAAMLGNERRRVRRRFSGNVTRDGSKYTSAHKSNLQTFDRHFTLHDAFFGVDTRFVPHRLDLR